MWVSVQLTVHAANSVGVGTPIFGRVPVVSTIAPNPAVWLLMTIVGTPL